MLGEIRDLMTAGEFDRGRTLQEQRKLLEAEADRLQAMIVATDAAIAAHAEGRSMSDAEMLTSSATSTHASHEDEARERWADSEVYQQSVEPDQALSQDDWQRIKTEARRSSTGS